MEREPSLAKNLALRAARGTLMGVITYVLAYYLPTLLYPEEAMPGEYRLLFTALVAILIFHSTAVEFTRGTIFQYAFGFSRVLCLLVYFIYATGGGIMHISLSELMELPIPLSVIVDARYFLFMLISVDLVDLLKVLLGAVRFSCEKLERESP
jgi:hypothetical protein